MTSPFPERPIAAYRSFRISSRRIPRRPVALVMALCLMVMAIPSSRAQLPVPRTGEVIPRDVREMYDRGLQYLATTQGERGDWSTSARENGPGTTGMALMVFLACGEDPNFGPYSNHVRRALRSIIGDQEESTGIMGMSMYHHGFAMLALAEAYGAVDERNLWPDGKGPRSIGQALELAVRGAITSQKKNPMGAWRYSPDSRDADTSVSGAVFVGLLAARNAGIEVPDEAINRAISFYAQMTSSSGEVAYTTGMGGFGDSLARTSIATLVFSVAHRKDLKPFQAVIDYLKQRIDQPPQSSWPEYARYYEAQALFQGDVAGWEKWNELLIRQLKQAQMPDGSFRGQMGGAVSTSLSLLALAVNFRFLPIYER